MRNPSLEEQEQAVLEELECTVNSFREKDGKVRNPYAVKHIACLRAAIGTIQRNRKIAHMSLSK